MRDQETDVLVELSRFALLVLPCLLLGLFVSELLQAAITRRSDEPGFITSIVRQKESRCGLLEPLYLSVRLVRARFVSGDGWSCCTLSSLLFQAKIPSGIVDQVNLSWCLGTRQRVSDPHGYIGHVVPRTPRADLASADVRFGFWAWCDAASWNTEAGFALRRRPEAALPFSSHQAIHGRYRCPRC